MYLSKVELDRENRKKSRDLHHVGAFHNWVEQSFPKEVAESVRSRKLWRLDHLQGRDYLLLVSATKPDLAALEKYGVADSAQTKAYAPFLHALKVGTRARFRVTLNPVMSISDNVGKRGRVVPHVTVEQQLQFLYDRAEKNGFSIKHGACTIVERGYVTLKKAEQKPLRLSKATYEGILTITDYELFIKTLIEGIGKKKAYGFGMMTVIPLEK